MLTLFVSGFTGQSQYFMFEFSIPTEALGDEQCFEVTKYLPKYAEFLRTNVSIITDKARGP